MPVRVLTVDDQAPFREVARDLVEVTPGFAAVGEAESGEEALGMTRSVAPDLILLDLRMSGMDGLETARRLRRRAPPGRGRAVTMGRRRSPRAPPGTRGAP